MKNYLDNLQKEIKDLICLAREIASKNNTPVYLVGGCVRDLILGVKNLDLDIVVEGDGIEFGEDLASTLKAKLIRHRRFGTATVVLRHNLKIDPSTTLKDRALSERSESNGRSRTIDIATARRETYPQPASLPVVTPGTLRDDLARRDFTVNAMAISITEKDFGKLIDFFSGNSDLRHKKIRVLHNLSFIDDPTRMLRAIRFEKRYNFEIESRTLHYLKEAVRLKMLEKVEPQRLRDELILVLKEEQPLKQIKRIQKLIGFGFVNPHLRILKNTYKLLNAIRNQIGWFEKIYARRRQIDTWLIYFMGLIYSLNINEVKAACKKFVFRKGEEKRILNCRKVSSRVMRQLSRDKIKPSKIFDLLEPLSYELILLLKAKSKNVYVQEHIEDFFEIYNGMRIQTCGDDLHRLGIRPGPQYQKIFLRVLKAKLNGLVETKEEELALINKMI